MADFSQFQFVVDGILQGDPQIISILVAVVVVLLTLVLYLSRSGASNRSGVLLLGLCDGGKTLIYSKLVDNRYVQTHTSVKENSGIYNIPDSKSSGLRILDLPGHERLRTKFLDQYKGLARGIVFVVDSLTVTKDIREVGECMYTVLTDQTIASNTPPILIACNKQDQTLAKGARVIQAALEKELTTVRKTKAAALEGTSSSATKAITLGRANKNFQFSDLKQKVDFVECSARGAEEDDLDGLTDWLAKLA